MDEITPEQALRKPQALGSSVIYSCERSAKEHPDPEFRTALLELASKIEPFVVYEYSGDTLAGWAFENWSPIVRLEPIVGAPIEEWPVVDDDPDAFQVTLYITTNSVSVEVS